MPLQPTIHPLFEPKTSTWQYVVVDAELKTAVIIDPVFDFDPNKSRFSTESADGILALVRENGYHVLKILETHVHADHVTASHYLQLQLSKSQHHRPDICIGSRVRETQYRFRKRYQVPEVEYENAFDHLFRDDEEFSVGRLEAKAIHLPGHTPDHMGYVIGGNLFCGDSLFNPDVGSARCDFPGGDASSLYNSAQRILEYPSDFKIWTGHDYPPGGVDGRIEPLAATTVEQQKRSNKHLKQGVDEHGFVQWRTQRDSALAAPRLLHQSLQINIRAGKMPTKNSSGHRLLHVPLQLSWE
ncbi:beta-lactamase-like protein [Thelonectria olida]|uniref:Beta-lactamase-like protein n=1 Tax=Thelonectria olida TaxID=1576542 RepID=A0A9P9AUM7_9HYPO|nr:beta-lactamase-like protein [Thelonectria olida]